MRILNYSFLELEKYDCKKVYDNKSFFDEIFFKEYIIFLSNFCDEMYYKKALEIGDFCYLYSDYEKLIYRINYLKKKLFKKDIFKFNDFFYNVNTKSLYLKNKLVPLTKSESELLYFLFKNSKRFVSNVEIIENCDFINNLNSIKVIISNLRKKGIDIINKKNLGYKINLKEEK
jgi:two-component system OmpR family response regulator